MVRCKRFEQLCDIQKNIFRNGQQFGIDRFGTINLYKKCFYRKFFSEKREKTGR